MARHPDKHSRRGAPSSSSIPAKSTSSTSPAPSSIPTSRTLTSFSPSTSIRSWVVSYCHHRILVMVTTFFVLVVFTSQSVRALNYAKYSDVKAQIRFPAYTPEERKLVAQQAASLMQVYVNRDIKLQAYGDSIDPIPRTSQVLSDLSSPSPSIKDDKTLHQTLSTIFQNLHDLHTSYELPKPYSCYQLIFPIEFGLAESDDIISNPLVVVKGFSTHRDPVIRLNIYSKEVLGAVNVGDTLVSIDGKSFRQLFEEFKSVTGGANVFGGHRALMNYLTLRPAETYLLPDDMPGNTANNTEVTYVFKKLTDGSEYTVKLPLVVGFDRECLGSSTSTNLALANANSLINNPIRLQSLTDPSTDPSSEDDLSSFRLAAPTPPTPPTRRKDSIKKQLKEAIHPFLEALKEASGGDLLSADYPRKRTQEDIVSWALYTYNPTDTNTGGRGSMKIGILRLDSFRPKNVPEDQLDEADWVVQLVRGLLVKELADTDALIIDVRDNQGGLITLAEGIPQLFIGGKKTFEPAKARVLVNPINERILTASQLFDNTDWKTSFAESKNSKYTRPVAFTTPEYANAYGQAYFKPVAVFTNGNCFSACDMFTAGMQDSGAALIIGEDPQTGAGGTNVMKLDFFTTNDPSTFSPLPPRGDQTIRIGWRQIVRANTNQEAQLIEERGVVPEKVFRPTPGDFVRAAALKAPP
ncbi:hypothetical protein HK102_004610, partial [Quaeritorhiza haematococci]